MNPENSTSSAPTEEVGVTRFLLQTIGRRRALLLLSVVACMSVFDMAGIAIIFPFLDFATDPSSVANVNTRLGQAPDAFTHAQLIAAFASILVLLYVCKTISQLSLLRVQARCLAQFTATVTNEIVAKVLSARYAVFQDTAASEIGGIAYSSTVHANLALGALVQSCNEGLVLVLLVVGFFFFQPLLAAGALAFAIVAALLLYNIVIKRSGQIGEAQGQIETVRYRLLFSIASAIRDIKIMGLDRLFDARNRRISSEYAQLAWRYGVNAATPRVLIEFFALIAIVGIAVAVAFSNMSAEEAGPLLGLIAVATVRAVPGFYRLFSGVSAFRASSPVVVRLIRLRGKLANAAVNRKDDSLSFHRRIELRAVGFRYGDKPILRGINLYLDRGESVGIVGSSGAGKTTLLDLFTGLQPATEGEFYADDVRFDPFASQAIHRMIGYVPQTIALLDETIAFNVAFEEDADLERVAAVLKMANLETFIASLPLGVSTRVGENGLRLSGGQRQRIGIARALYRAPEILVFDEATSSLDTRSEEELTREIEKLHGKISVLIVAHRLSTVIGCDRIYVLADGKIESCGTHEQLLVSSDLYRSLYATQRGSPSA